MPKKALITGITGQDGSYLAELLLAKGYEVHGIIRRASTFNTGRLDDIYADPHAANSRLCLHYGDLGDASSRAGSFGPFRRWVKLLNGADPRSAIRQSRALRYVCADRTQLVPP